MSSVRANDHASSSLLTKGNAMKFICLSLAAAALMAHDVTAADDGGRGFDRAPLLAKAIAPMLRYRVMKPVRIGKVLSDRTAYQGWTVRPAGAAEDAYGRILRDNDEVVFDFGEHLVGRFAIALERPDGGGPDKVHLQLTFAEMPCELGESPASAFRGTLTPSWLQVESVAIEGAPVEYELPGRYAFRYVRVRILPTSPVRPVAIASVRATAESSADWSKVSACAGLKGEDRRLYEVAAATLRDSMQACLEDGPKRDRRLWLGDLRLQALANYRSFRNFEVVRRSLYLCAACSFTNGMTATQVHVTPTVERGTSRILDYTALFGTTVLEYLEESGDREAAEDLWPCARASAKAVADAVDGTGLVREENGWWNFIDWQTTLNRQASEQGAIVFGLRRTQELAAKLGREREVEWIPQFVDRMCRRAVEALWDSERGVWVSGAGRNVSWMSQAYLAIAGVGTDEMRRSAIVKVRGMSDAVRPRTPYAYHYFASGLVSVGLREEALQLVRDYWGGMVKKGADTFWEVYDPEDDFCSPYKTILLNSYCHAWSCAPLCFLGGEQ